MEITVVIPLYNKELYIRRTIDSVLRQVTPPDEILVIDDGSTDHSAQEVLNIHDPRIRLIQQMNAGECAARNRGLKEARNDLVALLDADDEWKPDFLTHIQRLYQNFPGCGIYATAYEVTQPGGGIYYPKLSEIPAEPWTGILNDFLKNMQAAPPFYSSSTAVSREKCLAVGGFPAGVKRGGDIITWVRMGVRYPIAFSPSRQARYHAEALNRACDTFTSDVESPASQEIIRLIDQQQVPPDLVPDLKEYGALLNIRKAKEVLFSGNPEGAHTLLRKARNSKRHRLERIWWLFWSGKIPSRLLPQLRDFRARFR